VTGPTGTPAPVKKGEGKGDDGIDQLIRDSSEKDEGTGPEK
jgi:hypothetical protein